MDQKLIKVISIALNDKDKGHSRSVSLGPVSELIKASKRHGVISSLYRGLQMLDDPAYENILKILAPQYYAEVRLNCIQLSELTRIQTAFEQNKIYSLPIKGCNTKYRYPDTVLRSMGDIDILIKPQQNDKVKKILFDLGYSTFQEGRKHDHYWNSEKICVEIHRDILSAESEYYGYYKNVWNRCSIKENCKYTYEMDIEDEYILNILHLVEHFKSGGIGIRFIMDVYVYRYLNTMDLNYIKKQLDQMGLIKFEKNIVDLSALWFGRKRYDSDHRKHLYGLANYIYSGGTFGDHSKVVDLVAAKGKTKYLFKNVFPNYDSMVSMFPWLMGKRFLLPLAWIIRWIKSFIFRRRKIGRVFRRVFHIKRSDKDRIIKIKQFYSTYGLKL